MKRVLAVGVAMAMAGSAQAFDATGLDVSMSNDVVAGQDQNLSNAFEARLFFDTQHGGIRQAAKMLTWSNEPVQLAGVLGHDIYTPEDRISAVPILNDRPYAGRLSVGLEGYGRHGFIDTRTRFDLGVVGPGASGEAVQDAWHRLWGNDRFNGWDNQIEHRVAWGILHQQSASLWRSGESRVEIRPHWGAQIGNWQRRIHVGGTVNWRISGEGDVRSLGEAMRAGAKPRGFAAWAGIQHDYVFADNSLREGRGGAGSLITPNDHVAVAQVGLRYDHDEFSVGVARAWSQKQYREQDHHPSWGSVTVAVRF